MSMNLIASYEWKRNCCSFYLPGKWNTLLLQMLNAWRTLYNNMKNKVKKKKNRPCIRNTELNRITPRYIPRTGKWYERTVLSQSWAWWGQRIKTLFTSLYLRQKTACMHLLGSFRPRRGKQPPFIIWHNGAWAKATSSLLHSLLNDSQRKQRPLLLGQAFLGVTLGKRMGEKDIKD